VKREYHLTQDDTSLSEKLGKRIPPVMVRWFSTMALIRRRKLSLVGAILVITFLVVALSEAIFKNAILPYPVSARYEPYLPPSIFRWPPNLSHIFGTDPLGRDLFSQVVAALPLDAEVALLVIFSAVVIGVTLGILAGFLGGKTNQIIMRVTDIFIAFPGLILAIAIAASLGPGLIHSMEALAVIWWPTYTRLARGEALAIKDRLYVEAARAAGLSNLRIMLRHIAPNIVSPLIVYATLDIGNVIIQTSVLAYVGLGAQPPTPELGRFVFDYQQYLFIYPWLVLIPGAIIFFIVLGFNLLGDGLRDVLDPRMQRMIALTPRETEEPKNSIEVPASGTKDAIAAE
jgi:peptide/nickel transport system permease protein